MADSQLILELLFCKDEILQRNYKEFFQETKKILSTKKLQRNYKENSFAKKLHDQMATNRSWPFAHRSEKIVEFT